MPLQSQKTPSIVTVERLVRFAASLVADAQSVVSPGDSSPALVDRNTFAAAPAAHGLAMFVELAVAVRGEIDDRTGYLINITAIDRAVREHAAPQFQHATSVAPHTPPAAVLRAVCADLVRQLPCEVVWVRWNLTPYYSLTMHPPVLDRVLLSQSFEFAAAHRLHCDDLDAERNREIFGKCNNPSGHGHNYRLQVQVQSALDEGAQPTFGLRVLERVVRETVIERFDHTHLNRDTVEFARLNPSVENITRTCFDLLRDPIAKAGGVLKQVTVWETEKTSCTYPA